MEMSFSEMLFYGGIIGMATIAAVGVIMVFVMYVRGNRLKTKLDEEYGKQDTAKKQ